MAKRKTPTKQPRRLFDHFEIPKDVKVTGLGNPLSGQIEDPSMNPDRWLRPDWWEKITGTEYSYGRND